MSTQRWDGDMGVRFLLASLVMHTRWKDKNKKEGLRDNGTVNAKTGPGVRVCLHACEDLLSDTTRPLIPAALE